MLKTTIDAVRVDEFGGRASVYGKDVAVHYGQGTLRLDVDFDTAQTILRVLSYAESMPKPADQVAHGGPLLALPEGAAVTLPDTAIAPPGVAAEEPPKKLLDSKAMRDAVKAMAIEEKQKATEKAEKPAAVVADVQVSDVAVDDALRVVTSMSGVMQWVKTHGIYAPTADKADKTSAVIAWLEANKAEIPVLAKVTDLAGKITKYAASGGLDN